jgi:hypothetical protein
MSEEVKRIKLTKPFELHGRSVEEITLREPTGWEAATLGEPRLIVANQNLGGYYVERDDVIAKYLEKCVDCPLGPNGILKVLSLTDLIKVKQALFSFFEEAEARIAVERLANFASAQNESQSAKSAN